MSTGNGPAAPRAGAGQSWGVAALVLLALGLGVLIGSRGEDDPAPPAPPPPVVTISPLGPTGPTTPGAVTP